MCRRDLLTMAGVSAGATLLARRPLLADTSFKSIKQIVAGVLNVGYVEVGPSNGPAVLLLHGWPYDIHSYVEVAQSLASGGYRVVVPYLRGYGATRFLSEEHHETASSQRSPLTSSL
jgi:alpha-beta hydrolase superfamily lysophospholipase